MKIIEKIRELDKKYDNVPVSKVFWVIPLVEVLSFSTLFISCIRMNFLLVFGYESQFPMFSGFAYFLLKLGILYNSFILKLLSFVPFIIKFVFSIFLVNGKRKFVNLTGGLYLVDFIFSLVFLITGNYEVSCLKSEALVSLILHLVALVVIQIFLFFLLVVDKLKIVGKFKEQPKHVRKELYSKTILATVIFSVTTSIVFAGVWLNDSKAKATEDEVLVLNRCYGYSEKYLYKKLPDDEKTLKLIVNDIDSVIETDIFKNAFNQSKYKNRILSSENESSYPPLIIKSEYANELMFLKCKILLQLDKETEYISYYKNNYKYFGSTWTKRYYEYVNENIDGFTEEQKEIIKKGYKEILASDASDFEKYNVFMGIIYFFGVENEGLAEEEISENPDFIKMKKLAEESFENMNYVKDGGLIKDGFNWLSVKDKLYMFK